jgi:hypothetical protein
MRNLYKKSTAAAIFAFCRGAIRTANKPLAAPVKVRMSNSLAMAPVAFEAAQERLCFLAQPSHDELRVRTIHLLDCESRRQNTCNNNEIVRGVHFDAIHPMRHKP